MSNQKQETLKNVDLAAFQRAPFPLDYIDSDIVYIEKLEALPQVCSIKLQFNVFVVCREGKLELEVAGSNYTISKGEVFICPSGRIIDNVMVSPDFDFSLLCLTDRVIQMLLSTNIDIWNRAVYYRRDYVGKIENAVQTREFTSSFMSLIRLLIEKKDNPFREEMVRSMLQMVLLGFCARKKQEEDQGEALTPQISGQSQQGKIIFTRFMELLKNELVRHKPVYYYAEKLCISAKYLSHICKEMSGKSANEFIHAAVIEDITYYLKNTNLSVKEISGRLGFANISFFGKYVKAHFGESPNDYRKRLYKGQQ